MPTIHVMGMVVEAGEVHHDVGREEAAAPGTDEGQLFRMALGAAHAVAWVWDVEQDVLAWFGDVERLYGLPGSVTSGPSDTFIKIVHPDDQEAVIAAVTASLLHAVDYEVEYRSVLTSGVVRWHRTKGTTVVGADGRVTRLLGVATDITDRREADERLAHLALHDALTGLPNRALLLDRLALGLGREARSASRLAVLFVDLDGFKDVNDRHGHEVGDAVLVATAERLRAVLRPADTIARLGGDEFVVVAEVASPQEGSDLATRLVHALRAPHVVSGVDDDVVCPASIGVRLAGPGATVSSLLKDADAAMYRAKGRNEGAGGWSSGEGAPAT